MKLFPGHGVGSKQTVPTLNLKPGPEVMPRKGVYITEAEDLEDGRRWQSITNAGVRPTFGGHDMTVETLYLSPFGEAPNRPCGFTSDIFCAKNDSSLILRS